MSEIYYDGDLVEINRNANINPYWKGKTGRIIRWVHGDFYLVKVEDKELVMDASRSEFSKIELVKVEPY